MEKYIILFCQRRAWHYQFRHTWLSPATRSDKRVCYDGGVSGPKSFKKIFARTTADRRATVKPNIDPNSDTCVLTSRRGNEQNAKWKIIRHHFGVCLRIGSYTFSQRKTVRDGRVFRFDSESKITSTSSKNYRTFL